MALGYWRGRASHVSAVPCIGLLNLPLLALVLWFTSSRNWALLALAVATILTASLGLGVARGPGRHRLLFLLLPLVAGNTVAAALVPPFVHSLVVSDQVDEASSSFRVLLLDGRPLDSQTLEGRVVILDLWATWCVPCVRELPELGRLAARLPHSSQVTFLAVEVGGATPAQARAFLAQHGPGLIGATDSSGSLAAQFGVDRLPALFVLDGRGRTRFRHLGFVGAEDLASTLRRTINDLLARLSSGGPTSHGQQVL